MDINDNGRLHLQMFSVHGLLRSQNMELGFDADTGGQIKYVVELGKALSENKGGRQVDLFTRLIRDDTLDDDYSRQVEIVTDKFRIVRIPCGPPRYIRKELLWPYLDEFIKKPLNSTKNRALCPTLSTAITRMQDMWPSSSAIPMIFRLSIPVIP